MRFKSLVIPSVCLLLGISASRADDHPPVLRAVATAAYTDVHPDTVFEVTVALENVTDTVQTIKIPDCGWDRVWRSSNRHITWDFWDCDYNEEITIQIQPHQSYVFEKPLKMFVNLDMSKETRMDFRMGFRTRMLGKTVWSSPVSLDVTP